MKFRKFSKFLVFFLLFSLASCKQKKNDVLISLDQNPSISYIESDNSIKTYTTSVNTTSLNKMIDDNSSFILITYDETCPQCNKIKPYIINYICSTHYVIHSLDIFSEDDELISSSLNKLQSFDTVAVPRIFFVSEGNCIYVQNGFTYDDFNQNYVNHMFNYYIK